ncbi:MAG: NAD-dependent epimerase/dehydratase family protein, partial [Nitrospiraceae bacterium]|nr:NAD-dependent epimerase/dehydratase family protein [Nitrospiraceae bacterium]
MSTTFWPKQKVLVTGGSGFLGTHLCRRLVECGAEVHATSRVERDQRELGPRWWQADVVDIGATRRLLSEVQPDIIYHLAGSVTAVPDKEFVLPTFHSLLTSTVNLLAAVTDIGCRRLILCGSLDEPQAPQGEVTPSSPYAAAKWAASGYGRMFQALYGTPVVVLRTFMTYGPYQDTGKLIPSVILSFQEGRSPKLSSGRWQADWIYVDDVIEGFLAAAQRPDVEGCTLDLGSGTLISVRAIVEQLVAIMRPSIQPLFGVLPDSPLKPQCVANIVESEGKLDWHPETSLSAGLL